jgi:co-chaperonin GroES (HSP10)
MKSDIQKVKPGYRANQVSNITPLGDSILVRDMNFEHRVTTAGIILPSDDGKDSGIRPRWAQIYAVGPLQVHPELQPGKWILVSHGRWTRGIKVEVDGEQFTIRRVDNNEILLVSDEPVEDDTMSNKVVA